MQPPPGFLLDSPNFQHVSVGWGQRRYNALGQALTETDRQPPIVRFYNTPFAYIEVIKVDGDDANRRLSGAVFEVTPQGTGSPIIFDNPLVTDINGRIFIPNTLLEGVGERVFLVCEALPPLDLLYLITTYRWLQ